MSKFRVTAYVILGVVAIGCKKSQEDVYTRMGEGAPAIAAPATLAQFAVGFWSENDLLSGGPGPEPTDIKILHEFKSDGTFTITRMKDKHVISGTFVLNGNLINLTYKAVDGKPIRLYIDALHKAAETGTTAALTEDFFADWLENRQNKMTYLSLSSDGKQLEFTTGDAPGEGSSLMGSLPSTVTLERVSFKQGKGAPVKG